MTPARPKPHGTDHQEDLPKIGIDGQPIIWRWDGAWSGAQTWTTSYATDNVRGFHAADLTISELLREHRFRLAPESRAYLHRTQSSDGTTRNYHGSLALYFDRGRLGLKIRVDLDTDPNASNMIRQRGVRKPGMLIAPLAIVAGRGRKRAVEARARELTELASDIVYLVHDRDTPAARPCVLVTYFTRSGKYGRLGRKVASRYFSLEEARQFSSLPLDILQTHEEREPAESVDSNIGFTR
jgi:hypothetical protein